MTVIYMYLSGEMGRVYSKIPVSRQGEEFTAKYLSDRKAVEIAAVENRHECRIS